MALAQDRAKLVRPPTISRRTENHATNLAEAAETISQITGSVGEAAEGAAQTNALVNVAVSEAKQSGSIVRKAVDAMGNIEQATQEIGKIIGVIEGITRSEERHGGQECVSQFRTRGA